MEHVRQTSILPPTCESLTRQRLTFGLTDEENEKADRFVMASGLTQANWILSPLQANGFTEHQFIMLRHPFLPKIINPHLQLFLHMIQKHRLLFFPETYVKELPVKVAQVDIEKDFKPPCNFLNIGRPLVDHPCGLKAIDQLNEVSFATRPGE